MNVNEIYLYKGDHLFYRVRKVGPKNLLTLGSPVIVKLICVDKPHSKTILFNEIVLKNGVYVTRKTDQHSIYWEEWYLARPEDIPRVDIHKDMNITLGKKKVIIEDLDTEASIATCKISHLTHKLSLNRIDRLFYTGHWKKVL